MNTISSRFEEDKALADDGRQSAMDAVAPAPAASSQNLQRRRLRYYILLMIADTAVIALAFAIANFMRFAQPFHDVGLRTFAVMWPFYLALALNGRAYSIDTLKWPRRSAIRSAKALLLAITAFVLILFSLKVSTDFSRLVFGYGSMLALIMLVPARYFLGRLIGRRENWVFRNEVLLVDGVTATPSGTERLVSAEAEAIAPTPDDPAMFDKLGRLLGSCDRVILACPYDRRKAWADMLKGANVDVEIVAPELEAIGALELRRHNRRATLLVACGPIGLRDRATKRALDLAIALPALLFLALPMVVIGTLVRLGSPGPALFRQPRMGYGNQMFQMLKFRTMRDETSDEHGTRSASREDDRLTRIGGFLRRTSLDELPQLWNVLRGEMSIVGPRPHALGSTAEDASFWHIDKRYWDRHAVKPGMTGLAQIRGFRGATDTREDLTDRLQADLEYLAGWTLGRDVMIILRTARVLVHKKAY